MAAVDGLSLPGADGRDLSRWAVAGAVALALHAGILLYLRNTPAPVGFDSQVPIELDLMPPPSGQAQRDEAGAEIASAPSTEAIEEQKPDETEQQPPAVEELPDINPDETPPPPDSEVVAAEQRPDETAPIDRPEETPVERLDDIQTAELPDVSPPEEQPQVQMEVPPDLLAPPPDVQEVVTLPPETTVTAREEEIEPPKPPPPTVARRPEPRRETPRPVAPRREAVRDEPRRAPPRTRPDAAERARPAAPGSVAGGRSGASSNAGAARAASANYGRRLQALVAAQQRRGLNLSGQAVISFTVNRSGRIVASSVSGGGQMGSEAQAMLRRAAGSFPPMPSGMTQASQNYSIRVNFTPGR